MGFKLRKIVSPKLAGSAGGLVWSLIGAVIAGIGWKLGADLYDAARDRIADRPPPDYPRR